MKLTGLEIIVVNSTNYKTHLVQEISGLEIESLRIRQIYRRWSERER
mgnify:CR=1 FL=1